MKKLGVILIMLFAGLKVSAQSAVSDTVKFSAHKNEISTFLKLIHIAGLDSIFSGKPVTILAPDNKAFEELSRSTLDSLLKPDNKAAMTKLIDNHILSAKLTASEISKFIHAEAPAQQYVFTAVSGNKIIAKINSNRNIILIDKNGNESIVKAFDISYGNAEIFIISTLIQ